MLRGAVAAARAGGQPIAELVYFEEESNRGCWLAATITTVLTFGCVGCGGLGAVIWFIGPW